MKLQFYPKVGLMQKPKSATSATFLLLVFVGLAHLASAQLYQQTFDTPLSLSSNTLFTSNPYCSATPNNTQISSIGSNGPGCTFEVPSGTGRLTFNRSADVGTFTRGVDYSPIPTTSIYKFDLTVSNNSVAQVNGAKFQVGYNFDPTTFIEDDDVNIHSRLGINWTATPGEFSLRNGTNTISSANFSGTQTITFVINKGGTVSYLGPDGLVNSIGTERNDVWVGNTLVFDDITVVTSARFLRRFKFFFNAGSAKLEFDNFLATTIPSAPTASSPQFFCGGSPTIANLAASGANLKWYLTATGGSPLPTNTPLVHGTTYYVSQNPDGYESHRTAVVANVLNVGISNNTVAASQIVCTGSIPDPFTGLVPIITNGTGTFTYQWEISSTSAIAGFSNISGAINQDYAVPSSLSANRWYRRKVTADGCIDYSNVISVTVNSLISNVISSVQTICEGATPATLTGVPTGGNGSYSYQWESSTTDANNGFSPVLGAESQTFSSGPLSATTWFRRVVTAGPCPVSTSTAIQITVVPAIADNTIGSDQTICTSTIPAGFSGSNPTGGTGTFSYQWEVSSTGPGSGFSNISGATSVNYAVPSALTGNRWYRRRVNSGACLNNYSNVISVTINPVIGNNTITAAQTICSSNAASTLNGSNPTGGSGAYTYQWESSTTSATLGFSPINDATTQNYNPGFLSQTTWFRRVVISPPCANSVSSAIQITVNNPIVGNSATGNQTICNGVAAAALVGTTPTGGNGSSYTYLWEVATAMPGTFASASGTNSQINYSPGAISATRWYRRRVTSGVCPVTYSDTIQVVVNPVISGNTISAAQTICSTNPAATLNGSNPIGGNGAYSYQWESSITSGSSGFSAISGANDINYSPGILAQTTWFRRVVISPPCANSISAAIQITVNYPIDNNSISASQNICSGTSPATFIGTPPTGGTGSFTYLWEVASSPGVFAATSGTSINYNPGTLNVAVVTNRWYRRRVTSGVCGVTYSNEIQVTINPPLGGNTITGTQTVCAGFPLTLFTGSNPTGSTGSYTYQWQSSTTSNSTGFSDIPGGDVQVYSPGTLNQTTWFRRIVISSPCANSTSSAITVTVQQPIGNNDISENQSICSGSDPSTFIGTLPTGGTGSYSYLWEVANSLPGTFGSAGSNTINFASGALTADRWFRRRVTSGVCPASYSDTLYVNVTPSIAANNISSDQLLCNGAPVVPLTGSTPSGGNGTMVLRWESSTTSASAGFSTIPGQTGTGYNPGTLLQTTWFRRWAQSGACNVSSNVIQITVSPAPTLNVGPAIPEIPQGGTTIALGGSFGGSATGAVWSSPMGGVFMNNGGSTPHTATYTATGSSPEWVPLVLTSVGGSCGTISVSKLLHVRPDTNGISGSPNVYVKVIAPSLIAVGTLSITVEAGGGSKFSPGDRAMIMQMKGATASNTATDAGYGSILSLGSSGNYEFVTIGSVSGDVITLQRCTKKLYSTGFKVQLIKVARYTGNKIVVSSDKVTTVQLTRKGMGYVPNSVISGITVDNTGTFGSGLDVTAKSDALGQIVDVTIVNPGSGYVFPPKIIFPDPTVAPYNLAAYKAKANALLNFSGKQWNGETGGVMVIEVAGNLNLGSNIEMSGMGLAGGMFGEKVGGVDCGVSPNYGLDFFTGFSQAGQRGEGLNPLTASANQRGRGKNTTGGGGGYDADGGGGGGANWNDGGRGGSSSYTYFPCTQFPCDNAINRGGIGGTSDGAPNGIRARAYNYNPDKNRVFLGGGGGGGHSISNFLGEQLEGAGGYGGGLIFIKCDTLTSNGFEVRAEGMPGEDVTTGGGAGGGGAGGAIMMSIRKHRDTFNGRVNGGRGGNTEAIVCATINDLNTYRFSGAGGGGGGGVVWFSQDAATTNSLALGSLLGQSQRGTNQDNFGNSALKGSTARDQDSFEGIENLPYLGSVFTVGGTSPVPNFPNLQSAATWLAFKGSDASEITLLVKENTSTPSKIYDYQQPVTFTRIFTPGCTYGDATLVIKPWTAPNSVDLRWPDANRYMLLDGIPSVTFKDLTVSSDSPEIPYMIEVQGDSKLVLENVTVNGGVTLKTGSFNSLELKNTNHGGNITLETDQVATIFSSTQINGFNSLNRQLVLNSGSTLNMGPGTLLNMNGASITNNGGTWNIDPNAEIRLSGNLVAQAIGGTATTTFDKLNITSTGIIAINTPTIVREWNQTGSATINHNTRTLTVTELLTPGTGGFVGSGAGRVILQNPAQIVQASGFFANLEVDAPWGVNATAPITLSGSLTLTAGKLKMNNHLLTVNGTSSSSITHQTGSWIVGTLRQRVVAGNTYNLPIGTNTNFQRGEIKINSLVGLQNITVSFNSANPNFDPVFSSVNAQTEGLATYSFMIPDGYWTITPNAGTANYDLALFPSFAYGYSFYTIYKRQTNGNVWDMYGNLSNPENTSSYLQSDGSIRRTGFSGFSDFGIAVSEDPLPLKFLDFRAVKRSNGIRLNWKMADCQDNGRFIVKRAVGNDDFRDAKVVEIQENGQCQSEFETIDTDPISATKVYYQIEAKARNEASILSPVRVVQVLENPAENPFLSPVWGENKKFELVGPSLSQDGIRLFSMDGKLVSAQLQAENKILDLHSIPSGVYMVEMVNSGWTVRQKIVLGQ